jgi:hypothetical protein
LQFTYLALGLHKGRTSYRRRLQLFKRERSKKLKKNMKIVNFFLYRIYASFLPSWIRIWIRIQNADPDPATQIADPDPATQINADPCGSKSTTPANKTGETQTLGDMTSAPYSRLYRLDITSSRSLVFFTGKNLTGVIQGVTKKCRLSLLTNSALVIRVQMRGELRVSANECSCAHHLT